MKYIDEYRNKLLISGILEKINRISRKELMIMEVCGGHTWVIQKFGIPSMLPPNIHLLSGPGCPVCVTSKKFIDQAIAYSRMPNTIITTFGDLMKVPGSSSSLANEKSQGREIFMVYSILEAIKIAKDNPSKNVIFLGIGFETTAPGIAVGLKQAKKENLKNFFVFSSLKVFIPALFALVNHNTKVNGYILPGHVSTITGSNVYQKLPEQYKVACVISGFEPLDVFQSIYMLVEQCEKNNFKVETQYRRAVKPQGNTKAKQLIDEVFTTRDESWRGLGIIANSGFCLKENYSTFDTEKMFEVEVEETKEVAGCICGEILMGLKTPKDCKLFDKVCTPANPIGACMVSSEGACNAYYRFSR